jgi:flagellin
VRQDAVRVLQQEIKEDNTMAISINSNPVAASASLYLDRNNNMLNQSLSRLSSGSKLINASTDPGGLAVSMKLSAAINRQTAAITNVQNAVSFIQLQDGDIKAAASIVDRMAALRSMYDDVTKSDIDKSNYNTEFQTLRVQLYQSTEGQFNGVSLFSAETWGSQTVAQNDVIEVLTSERGSTGSKVSLGKTQLLSAVTVRDAANANANMTVDTYTVQAFNPDNALAASSKSAPIAGVDNSSLGSFTVDAFILALQNISTIRAENGSTSSRLQFASEQLEAAKVNLEAANSRIVDTDVAQESTTFARYSILTQAGAAMLSQANNSQSTILQMLLM